MVEARKKLIDLLTQKKESLELKKVTVGIDAFVDRIMRVVQCKNENECTFFADIAQFGQYVESKSGKSCGIEVCERFTKYGGNAPIMAEAIASLSVSTDCIAPIGFPDMDPQFKGLSPNLKFHCIGNPGMTTALEFEDGKVMLNFREPLNIINWEKMKEILTLQKIKDFFYHSNLIAMVNWAGMIHFNQILRGILVEVLPDHTPNKDQILFFDMADFSGRDDVLEAVELIKELSSHYKVIFGLNENEMLTLYRMFHPNGQNGDLMAVGQSIYDAMKVDAFILHTLTDSVAWSSEGIAEVESLYCQKPKLSTGGGDNFNAGLCFGLLCGLDFYGALTTANATSGFYVRNAKSPTFEELLGTIEHWDELIEKV